MNLSSYPLLLSKYSFWIHLSFFDNSQYVAYQFQISQHEHYLLDLYPLPSKILQFYHENNDQFLTITSNGTFD